MSNLSISRSIKSYDTYRDDKKSLPNLYGETPSDILRQRGASLNPIYASIMHVLYNPVGYSEKIISYCVLGGTSLGALLQCKWVDVQSFSQRILNRIQNNFPNWHIKIQILTSHLNNPSPLTKLHLAMLRLFRESFLQNFPEKVPNGTAVIFLQIAVEHKFSSMPRSKDILKLVKENRSPKNTFFFYQPYIQL